jgi:hypothetical protein
MASSIGQVTVAVKPDLSAFTQALSEAVIVAVLMPHADGLPNENLQRMAEDLLSKFWVVAK